jgi:hypothetical protein
MIEESDHEDLYPSIASDSPSSNHDREKGIADHSSSSFRANSEDESDSEYVPADGEDSDESADDELIENAEERAAIRDLVEDNAPNAEWRRIRVI